MKPAVLPALSLVPFVHSYSATHDLVARCLNLADTLVLPNTTIQLTEIVPGNTTLFFSDNDPSCNRPSQNVPVDLCRVVTVISTATTTSNSTSHGSISLEAWLPLAWNGRFLGTGNGGLNGCIQYEDVAYGTSRGFATVGSNNGHNGISGSPFLGNPAAVEDYVRRSLHLSAVLGKMIVAEFYGQAQTRSYYIGCSGGGRQGLREVQEFPGDFDGVVVGAPAVAFANLTSWRGSFYGRAGEPGDARFLTSDEWRMVTEDVLAQCDALDGYVDGIIEAPDLCHYRPAALLCRDDGDEDDIRCLTGAQLATVRSVFSDFYGTDGSLIFPRIPPGADPAALANGKPFQYSVDWFRYVLHQDPAWDPRTIGQDDYTLSATLDPFGVQTWRGDLSAARSRGVKILHYHGLRDPLITSDNSGRYYEHVSQTMGLTSREMDGFYRYFRVGGMNHCAGGPGAVRIGNRADNVAGWQPEGNVLSAIVRWVEDGVAPETIEGTGHDEDGVFSRRHCRYPGRNRYKGEGNPRVSESWGCV